MKKSRFSEQQIVAVLKEAEAGAKTADLCRKHGVSSATFYAWKSKFGGMEVRANNAIWNPIMHAWMFVSADDAANALSELYLTTQPSLNRSSASRRNLAPAWRIYRSKSH